MLNFRYKMESTLDVVVPVFNGANFLYQALTSIENQVCQPDQVILIDNCSSDNTAEIMKKWGRNQKNVSFFQNSQLLSFADNWNYGLRLAKSKYVHFLAHDDFIHQNFVRTFKRISKKYTDSDAFLFRVSVANESGHVQKRGFSLPFEYELNSKLQLRKTITRNPFNLAGAVFNREKMLEIEFMNPK